MIRLSEALRRLSHLFRRARFDRDLEEEMRLHMELRAEQRTREGASPEDAAYEARRRFGNATRFRETSREAWHWTFWETIVQDIRYGFRALLNSRGFTVTAVASLALGIGANTALFSIINAVMLRSLPVEDPGRLAQVKTGRSSIFTNPIWESVRDHQTAFSHVFAFSQSRFDLTEGGESRYAQGVWVSGGFFRGLGVPAVRGRVLTPEDDRPGCGASGPVAVISYSFWNSHFAGDPDILGKTVKLDRQPFRIVGVTASSFAGLDVDRGYDVAIPIGCEPLFHTDRSALNERSWWWLRIVGRLPKGVSLQEAEARMKAIAPEVNRLTVPLRWDAAGQKEYLKRTFQLSAAGVGFSATGERYRKALITLMAAVGLLLLIACANTANLMLARAASREREISVRLAIGASRLRVVRQLLTESTLLSFMGAACGTILAVWGSGLLVRLLSTAGQRLDLDVKPDWNVLAFTTIVAVATGLLFGIVPALRATSRRPADSLKERTRGTIAGSSRYRLGKALMVAQVALSLILLTGAGLFVQTLRNLLTVDAGFDRHALLLVKATVQEAQVAKERRGQLFERILERIRTIPPVRSASQSDSTPASHWVWNEDVHPEGYGGPKGPGDTLVYFNHVSPGYFRTMGTSLVAGRDFDERDNRSGPLVMVIGQATAKRFWPAANPIGKTIELDRPMEPGKRDAYQVVGVVKDVKYEDLGEKTLMTGYVAAGQNSDPWPSASFELRVDGKVESVVSNVRAAIADVDRNVSLEFRTMETQIADSLIEQRLLALLSSFFGLLALCLAVTGLYGLVAYMTERRRGEIGIRMALGARYGSVLRLVLGDVAWMLAGGVIIGVAGAVAAGRLVMTLCYGVSPQDWRTLSVAIVVLCGATGVAAYLPARRAGRMDPMNALREE